MDAVEIGGGQNRHPDTSISELLERAPRPPSSEGDRAPGAVLARTLQLAVAEFLRNPSMQMVAMSSMGRVPDVRVSFYRKLPTMGHLLL